MRALLSTFEADIACDRHCFIDDLRFYWLVLFFYLFWDDIALAAPLGAFQFLAAWFFVAALAIASFGAMRALVRATQ